MPKPRKMARRDAPRNMRIAAIVSLDPSGAGNTGIAVRLTARLKHMTPNTPKLPAPDYVAESSVWDGNTLDELTTFLFRSVEPGGRALLVVENSAFRSYTIARSIGTSIGAVKSALIYSGLLAEKDIVFVTPRVWRKTAGIAHGVGREYAKAEAVRLVGELYDVHVGDDAAEAVLLGDHAVRALRARYEVKKVRNDK